MTTDQISSEQFDTLIHDISTASDWSVYRDGVAAFADNEDAIPSVRAYWQVVREALEVLEEQGDSPARPIDLVEHGVGHRPQGGARGGNQYGAFTVRVPSEKQTRFVGRLLATRVVVEPGEESVASRMRLDALTAFRAGTANLRQTSDLITWLLTLPERPAADEDAVVDPASPKQAALITKLQFERDLTGFASVDDPSSLSKREASALIDALFKLPKATPAESAPGFVPLVPGVYRTDDGTIYKVYPNQTRERLLAKRLIVEVTGVDSYEGRWDYAGMAARFVKASQKMTREQAAAFGHEFGICAVCGAQLTDPTSIDRGIGPVCFGRLA